MIRRFHDSLFAGHLGVSRTIYPCPRRVPMGHANVGHRWDRVAMDLLDMSVTTPKGNRYVLVMVDCFS